MVPRTVLVTGANGFIGRALCKRLVDDGWDIKGGIRTEDQASFLPAGVTPTVIGDIGPNTNWDGHLGGVDVVIHLAARVHVMKETESDPLSAFRKVNVQGTARLASKAAAQNVARFVFVSSIKVNGEMTPADKKFHADDAPAPQDAYGISKAEAEQCLRVISSRNGLETVIIRPPLVYGPDVRGNFLSLIRFIETGWPLPLSRVHNRRSFIYLNNFIDALAVCARHPGAANKTFLVSDGQDLSTAELVRQIGSALGKQPNLIGIPPGLLRFAAWAMGKSVVADRLLGSLAVDCSATCQTLDWQPPFSIDEGVAATVEAYRRGHNFYHT